jgi:hypothetical protein
MDKITNVNAKTLKYSVPTAAHYKGARKPNKVYELLLDADLGKTQWVEGG